MLIPVLLVVVIYTVLVIYLYRSDRPGEKDEPHVVRWRCPECGWPIDRHARECPRCYSRFRRRHNDSEK